MPGAKGIRAGRAYVELFADNSRLVKGLRAAQRKLQAFGASVRNIGAGLVGLGTAIAGPLLATAKIFTSVGDTLDKMSKRTGVSVESLSQLDFAAQQSGTSLATLETGVRNMQRSILDAERGLSTSVDSLKMLGLNVQQLKGLKPEDQFKLIADRIAQVPDESTQAALAMKLLGRAGTQLLPLMKNGAAGIEALQAEAERLGLTVGTDQAADAAKLGDAWGRVTSQLKAAAVQAGAALAPMLTTLAGSVSKVVRKVIDFVKENQGLIVTAFKVGTAIVAAGAALIALGVGISTFGTILGGITSALTAIGSVLGFLLSPVGLVIAAVTALGVVFTQTTDILWKETVTGGAGVEAWAVIRLGAGSTLSFRRAELIDDLSQGSGVPADAWLLEWDGGGWTRTGEQIVIYGDKGFRGVLFGATPEEDVGDFAEVYFSREADRWYALAGGWYFHGKIVLLDIAEGEAGFVQLDVGAGQDEREITVSCFSPYGPVEIGDRVAANWNTFSLHWDVMKIEGPVQPGCGLELVDDEQDPADGQLRVKVGDLAGDGLVPDTSNEACLLSVSPGCGILVDSNVNVDNSQLAGLGLIPGGAGCTLDVNSGCGLQLNGNLLEVNADDIVGSGLLPGIGGCHVDVDIGCGLEFDGNTITVRPQDIAGAGLEGDLVQPDQCFIQVSFPVNCGLAFSAGDQLVVDMNQMTGPGIKTWTNPSGCVGVQLDHGCGLKIVDNAVEVDTATLAGDGLNDLGGCQMSVLLGCNMEYGPSGEIQPAVASLAGTGLAVDAGGPCDKLKIDCNWIENNCDVGGGDLQAGCGINISNDTVSVDNSALAGIGLNAGAGCAVDVAMGCGLRLGGGGIEVDPSSLGSSDIVPTGAGCSLKTYGYNGVKQVVTAIDCDPYDPYACPVAVVESWTFENGLLKSVA